MQSLELRFVQTLEIDNRIRKIYFYLSHRPKTNAFLGRASPTKIWLRGKIKRAEKLTVPTSSVVLCSGLLVFASPWKLIRWVPLAAPFWPLGTVARAMILEMAHIQDRRPFVSLDGHFVSFAIFTGLQAIGRWPLWGSFLPFCRGWLFPSLSPNPSG